MLKYQAGRCRARLGQPIGVGRPRMTWRLAALDEQRSTAPTPPTATLTPPGSNAAPGPSSPSLPPAPASAPPAAVPSPPLLPSNDYLQSLEPTAQLPLPPAPAAAATAAAEAAARRDRQDVWRLVGVCGAVGALALATELNKGWIGEHQELAMSAVFLAGYVGIIVEEALGLSKAAVALILAAALWSIRATAEGLEALDAELGSSLGEVSAVIFFLLGAMTVVEVVDSHQGFKIITQRVRPTRRSSLLFAVAGLTFAMSSVLDNLTTTIVMVALLSRLCPEPEARRFLGAAVVVAANAGGAWTPIGDVTTTMLWIHGQISASATMRDLLLPSALAVALPVAAWAAWAPELQEPPREGAGPAPAAQPAEAPSAPDAAAAAEAATTAALPALHGAAGAGGGGGGSTGTSGGGGGAHASGRESDGGGAKEVPAEVVLRAEVQVEAEAEADAAPPRSNLVLSVGLGSLLMVPVLRAWAGLPPHMGMLACLGFLWLVTDAIHYGEGRSHLTVSQALRRVDSEAVLFFTGVLLAVAALEAAGLLRELAGALAGLVPQQEVVAGVIGLASAIVDNVPLVAATMGMYDMTAHPQDDRLWQLIAYCAGTGGSLLVIGSAAGVALMGLDRSVTFGWYAARITPWATAGYLAGLAAYVAQQGLASQP